MNTCWCEIFLHDQGGTRIAKCCVCDQVFTQVTAVVRGPDTTRHSISGDAQMTFFPCHFPCTWWSQLDFFPFVFAAQVCAEWWWFNVQFSFVLTERNIWGDLATSRSQSFCNNVFLMFKAHHAETYSPSFSVIGTENLGGNSKICFIRHKCCRSGKCTCSKSWNIEPVFLFAVFRRDFLLILRLFFRFWVECWSEATKIELAALIFCLSLSDVMTCVQSERIWH